MYNILVGIQARTGSTRLPGKVLKPILGNTIIDIVIWNCRKALMYINKYSQKTGINVDLAVLIPEGDEIKEHLDGRIDVVTGPEDDLIERYSIAMNQYNSDYLVRVTSDCPLLPPFLISKAINTCVRGKYDFLTNANPNFRTFFDGADIEVCSKELFEWLDKNAATEEEREHVFKIANENPPDWARIGHIFGYVDMSSIKLSIDTLDDYKLITKQMESLAKKRKNWEKLHGKTTAHNF